MTGFPVASVVAAVDQKAAWLREMASIVRLDLGHSEVRRAALLMNLAYEEARSLLDVAEWADAWLQVTEPRPVLRDAWQGLLGP